MAREDAPSAGDTAGFDPSCDVGRDLLPAWPKDGSCDAEYHAYLDCLGVPPEAAGTLSLPGAGCEAELTAIERCFSASPPPAGGLDAITACLGFVVATAACSSTPDTAEAAKYLCVRRSTPPVGYIGGTSEGCARALAGYYTCISNSEDPCKQPGRCEDEAAAASVCLEPGPRDPSAYADCAEYCIERYGLLTDFDAVEACLHTDCYQRADGKRMEDYPMCCRAPLEDDSDIGIRARISIQCGT